MRIICEILSPGQKEQIIFSFSELTPFANNSTITKSIATVSETSQKVDLSMYKQWNTIWNDFGPIWKSLRNDNAGTRLKKDQINV